MQVVSDGSPLQAAIGFMAANFCSACHAWGHTVDSGNCLSSPSGSKPKIEVKPEVKPRTHPKPPAQAGPSTEAAAGAPVAAIDPDELRPDEVWQVTGGGPNGRSSRRKKRLSRVQRSAANQGSELDAIPVAILRKTYTVRRRD